MQVSVSYPLEFRGPVWKPALHASDAVIPASVVRNVRSIPLTFHNHTQPFSSSKPCQNPHLCTCYQNGHQDSLSYSQPDSDEYDAVSDTIALDDDDAGIVINIRKIDKRCQRIESRIAINASLETVWGILTDYEGLSDFIPGLTVSQLLEKRDSYARLFQIGRQTLALGLKFNAKAVLDCYEKDLEILSSGRRRDIEFKMVEGDFEIFGGKWSIEEYDAERLEARQTGELFEGQDFQTILSYDLEVKPKLWLPVRLAEGKLCREIKTNLLCIRKEAYLRLASSCS